MLHDSLAYTAPEDLSKNEIVQVSGELGTEFLWAGVHDTRRCCSEGRVRKGHTLNEKDAMILQEFYPKVLAWQDFVVQQIPWAQAEADRVHREKGEAAEHGRKTENSEGQRNEDAAQTRLDEAAPEEKMLDVLLAANSEIIEALGDYHRKRDLHPSEGYRRGIPSDNPRLYRLARSILCVHPNYRPGAASFAKSPRRGRTTHNSGKIQN